MQKVILLVQDGWGIAPPGPGNYIDMANTPVFDSLLTKYPHCQNKASGNAVGLPKGTQGNSEVGHLHLGAGRIVWQMYEKINKAMEDGSFFRNEQILKVMDKSDTLHLMGLCSDEGVHAHTNHLLALLEIAAKKKKKVFIHFFADGRDVPEKSAKKYIKIIEDKCKELNCGKIISIIGRYYSMDRDQNWDRTKKAYEMLTEGTGFKAKTANEAIDLAYKRGDKTDYYIQPTILDGFQPIKDKDSVIFFNFRTDRPRQLTRAFISHGFHMFERKVLKVNYLAMTSYDRTFMCPVAFKEEFVKNNLGHVLAEHGLKQLRMAETEKYGHVTYFFNSQIEDPNKGEERIMIPSAKVPSYDEKPEMSAYEITVEAEKQIKSQKYDFILINLANCDLVGHSAVKEAIIKCVGVVDECTGRIVKSALDNNYTLLVTADHGSAEEKLYKDGTPKPAHSSNPINFILVTSDFKLQTSDLKSGGQKDVAPTILEIMGIPIPDDMTGKSLIK